MFKALQSNPEFVEFIRQKRNQVLKGMEIESFLIKPVQRLPKYVLLYKDLLKHTDPNHPDYENISRCLTEFSKINDANNEGMNKYLR